MKFVRAHISLEDSSASVQLRFPKFVFFFVDLIKRIVQFSLFILVINLFAYWTHEHFIEKVMEQRTLLYSRLQSINKEIDSIDVKVSKSYSNEDLLYAKFGLSTPDTSLREMGFGGAILPDSMLVWSAAPVRKIKSSITNKLDRMQAKINRTNNSYLDLQRYIENLQGNLQHTPSISPTVGYLSSLYGLRTHPVTGETEKMHQGIDISAPVWTAIYAPANGRVETISDSETLGKYVAIDHGNGIVTRYGHMIMPFTKEGQMVKRYDVIGYMGSTGRTTGSHLHYEVWINGSAVNPIYYMLPDQYSIE